MLTIRYGSGLCGSVDCFTLAGSAQVQAVLRSLLLPAVQLVGGVANPGWPFNFQLCV